MTENTGTPGAAGADEDGPSGTFDQTGGLMDEFEVSSELDSGTTVTMTKWRRDA